MNIDELVVVKVLCKQDIHCPPELLDTEPVDIYLLNQMADRLVAKGKRGLLAQQDLLDHLQYDVLHWREVEGLYCEFSAVLHIDPKVYFVSVVVLDAKHQA